MTEKRNRKQGIPRFLPGSSGQREISREKAREAARLALDDSGNILSLGPEHMGRDGFS
jgi:hypothetical protein